MRPNVITLTLAAADADNIALAQAPGAAGNLTLNGVAVTGGVATLDAQRRIGIASAGDDSLLTFGVYGTNGQGAVISEDVTGANAGVASTLQDFYTVTRVSVDDATAGNVTVGTTAVGSTPWVIPTTWTGVMMIGFQGEVLSGAPTWSVETSMESPWPPLPIYQVGHDQTLPIPTAFPLTGLSAQLGDAQGSISGAPFAAWRLTINAGSGSVKMTAIQAGSK